MNKNLKVVCVAAGSTIPLIKINIFLMNTTSIAVLGNIDDDRQPDDARIFTVFTFT